MNTSILTQIKQLLIKISEWETEELVLGIQVRTFIDVLIVQNFGRIRLKATKTKQSKAAARVRNTERL